jgi:hypothetical protein
MKNSYIAKVRSSLVLFQIVNKELSSERIKVVYRYVTRSEAINAMLMISVSCFTHINRPHITRATARVYMKRLGAHPHEPNRPCLKVGPICTSKMHYGPYSRGIAAVAAVLAPYVDVEKTRKSRLSSILNRIVHTST